MDKDQWPDTPEFEQLVKDRWNGVSGDRRQELVFIGLNDEIKEDQLTKALDECLINDCWDNPSKYENITYPFPRWF